MWSQSIPVADRRVDNWITISTIYPTLAMIIVYLLSIYVILPNYMKNRKPYSLKTVIYYFNIFQIVANAFIVYGIITSGWTTTLTLGCEPVDYSDDPEPTRMLKFMYYLYVVKAIDLIETMFYVLRKKDKQVSKLHVYHHVSTLGFAWILVKYLGGGMASFAPILNCSIHVIMYSYYFITSLGPKWQKRVKYWKPKITILQMMQFAIIIVHSLQCLHPNCNVQKSILLIFLPNVIFIFNMFWNFFKDNYIKKEQKSKM